MELSPDFKFQPLPPISPPPAAEQAEVVAESLDQGAAPVGAAAAAPNPLGRLAGLKGTWTGTGFNVIWRPNSVPGQDRFLELNLTTETLEFKEIPGPIPNRGLLQGDIEMFGLTYLQQISDANLGAGLHIEPGIWAHVPKTTDPKVPISLVRMASIPHGTTILAQGTSTAEDAGPVIPKVSIKPFSIGAPKSTIDFPEQDLTQKTTFRTPADGLVGVTQKMVNNPNSVLGAAISGQKFTRTATLQVSTRHKPILGGGTANTAFLAGGPNGPNADAVTVTSTFWIETVDADPVVHQLQYSQTVLLNFNGLSWPHITVATLRRS